MNLVVENNNLHRVRQVNKKRVNSIESKGDILMKKLNNFYYNTNKISHMLPIVNGESKISLRLLDWCVTNYSKTHKISYKTTDEYGNDVDFRISLEYKAKLKAYNKTFFDPFCRRTRIPFKYNSKNGIITTIGQLNFFMWAIKNNLIKYVEENFDKIEQDMIKANQEKKRLKKIEKEKKKQIYKKSINLSNKIKNKLIDESESDSISSEDQLTITATKTVEKNQEKIILMFN